VFAPISSGSPLPAGRETDCLLGCAPGAAAGEFSVAEPYDPRRSLRTRLSAVDASKVSCAGAYLSDSFLPDVFFLLGVGILQSMEKATQLVQGTPRLAASHRTYRNREHGCDRCFRMVWIAPSARDTSGSMLATFMQYQTRPTHFASSRCALSGKRSAMFRAALVLVCDNEPPKARMPGTLILWHVAGGVARA
jgi:hypothetical protein